MSSPPDETEFAPLLARFEQQWHDDARPNPEAFAENAGVTGRRRDTLVKVLNDLQSRLEGELRVLVRELADSWRAWSERRAARPGLKQVVPKAGARGASVRMYAELLRTEIEAREKYGDRPQIEQYRALFPLFQDKTAEVFERVQPTFSRTYRVTSQVIAECGQAQILLGRQEGFDRRVLIKRVRPNQKTSWGAEQRLRREARTLYVLERAGAAGVPRVLGIGMDTDRRLCLAETPILGRPDDPKRYLAEQFAAYLPLRTDPNDLSPVVERGEQSFAHKLTKLVSACRTVGVAHRHRLRIIHRDLSPKNILVDGQSRVFVIDWGLTVWAASDVPESVAEPAVVRNMSLISKGGGTPGYLSPEQAPEPPPATWLDRLVRRWKPRRAARPAVTPRSDVFTLGAVLFQLITGFRVYDCHTPWGRRGRLRLNPTSESDELVRRAWGYAVAPDPRRFNPTADEDLCAVCHKAIAPNPADRYADATELADALDAWVTARPGPRDRGRRPPAARAGS